MIAIALLLVLGTIIISILQGAIKISRGSTARGKAFENAQTIMQRVHRDFSQIVGLPPHPQGNTADMAFVLAEDPYGRQIIGFTRSWGEENRTLAGFDAGRGSKEQGWGGDYNGQNPNAQVRASGGNIEVVYMFEPLRDSLRLYRAERSPRPSRPDSSPPDRYSLLDAVGLWAMNLQESDADPLAPMAAIKDAQIGGESLWSQFELVAEDIVAFNIQCWDDDYENAMSSSPRTLTWFSGDRDGPLTRWLVSERLAAGKLPLPKAIRLTLIVASDIPVRAETELLAALPSGQTAMPVEDTQGFPDLGSGGTYLRINGELIAYAGKSKGVFTSLARGTLGTREQNHVKGDLVVAGDAFVKVIQFPVTR